MSSGEGPSRRSVPRVIFGVVLFIAWGVETVIWVASTVDIATASAVGSAIAAIALLALLAGMEGLEVGVIDRWRVLYPNRTTAELAAWLAARQLFVALIVTSVTLLSHRSSLVVINTDKEIVLRLFDLTWTGFTVLWFAQIFPKHLAATNPDRYLRHTRGALFPIVEVVRRVGVSQPGEWVASAVERRLDWPPTAAEEIEEARLPQEESLGAIWRELIPERAPRSAGRDPQDRNGPDRAVEQTGAEAERGRRSPSP
jgi:hypothetical protein